MFSQAFNDEEDSYNSNQYGNYFNDDSNMAFSLANSFSKKDRFSISTQPIGKGGFGTNPRGSLQSNNLDRIGEGASIKNYLATIGGDLTQMQNSKISKALMKAPVIKDNESETS